jgi:hypothetical protein
MRYIDSAAQTYSASACGDDFPGTCSITVDTWTDESTPTAAKGTWSGSFTATLDGLHGAPGQVNIQGSCTCRQ